MVSGLTLSGIVFTMLICFALPIGLAVYIYRNENVAPVSFLVGAGVFFVSQMVLRIPLINMMSNTEWFQSLSQNLIFVVLFYALTAGTSEEVGRFLGFRLGLKKHLNWRNGIAFGIGHGGFEAMALVGVSSVSNLIMSISINMGTFDSHMTPVLGNMAEPLKYELTTASSEMFFLAGIERMSVIAIHIALSLLVLYALKRRKFSYLFYAVMAHTIVNIPAALYAPLDINVWYLQIYLIILALVSIHFIRYSHGDLTEKMN